MVELRLSDGRAGVWRTFEVTVRDLTDDAAIGGLVLTGHDVTDRQRMQREMEHRALHDPLTGLPNRALLSDRFDQALRTAQRDEVAVGLLLIDLDRFKEINDTLGHSVGDELLVQVGPRFAGVLRESDTVARLGGDEFAVLLPSTSGIDAATLMQPADIAMYVAKQRLTSVAPPMTPRGMPSPERLALLGDLRRALRHGELLLHYQPKVSLSTGAVCGAEALVRWQHPTSIGQLTNLPISELKIDLSYVTTMDTDISNSLIVRSVIGSGTTSG